MKVFYEAILISTYLAPLAGPALAFFALEGKPKRNWRQLVKFNLFVTIGVWFSLLVFSLVVLWVKQRNTQALAHFEKQFASSIAFVKSHGYANDDMNHYTAYLDSCGASVPSKSMNIGQSIDLIKRVFDGKFLALIPGSTEDSDRLQKELPEELRASSDSDVGFIIIIGNSLTYGGSDWKQTFGGKVVHKGGDHFYQYVIIDYRKQVMIAHGLVVNCKLLNGVFGEIFYMRDRIKSTVNISLPKEAFAGEWINLKASLINETPKDFWQNWKKETVFREHPQIFNENQDAVQANLIWLTKPSGAASFSLGRQVMFNQPNVYQIWAMSTFPTVSTSSIATITIRSKK